MTTLTHAFSTDCENTHTQHDTFTPEWTDQAFDLLVEDPADAVLEVAVKDEHRVGKSYLLGKGTKALAELDADKWTGWVELQVRGGVPRILETTFPRHFGVTPRLSSPLPDPARKSSPPSHGQDEKGHAAGSIELSLELLPTPKPAAPEDDDAEADDAHAPKSTDNLDWHDMAARVTNASLSLRKYRMAVFFSNEESDTQGGIWWRRATKEMMIIFRGAVWCGLLGVVVGWDAFVVGHDD